MVFDQPIRIKIMQLVSILGSDPTREGPLNVQSSVLIVRALFCMSDL